MEKLQMVDGIDGVTERWEGAGLALNFFEDTRLFACSAEVDGEPGRELGKSKHSVPKQGHSASTLGAKWEAALSSH